MEIKNFKTKFALEDVVYFMYQNEISNGIITRIKIVFEESVYIHGSYVQRVVRKIKSFFGDHKTNVSVYYDVIKVKNDDTFYCSIGSSFREWELASSKEELFKILSENMKQTIKGKEVRKAFIAGWKAKEESEKHVPADLEEAAGEYEKKHTYQRYDGGGLTPEYDATLAEAFIAGYNLCRKETEEEVNNAEWQYEHDHADDRRKSVEMGQL